MCKTVPVGEDNIENKFIYGINQKVAQLIQ